MKWTFNYVAVCCVLFDFFNGHCFIFLCREDRLLFCSLKNFKSVAENDRHLYPRVEMFRSLLHVIFSMTLHLSYATEGFLLNIYVCSTRVVHKGASEMKNLQWRKKVSVEATTDVRIAQLHTQVCCCCRMHSTSVCIRYFSEPLYCTGWNRQLIVKVDLTGRTARPFSNNHKREKTIVNLNSLRAVCVVCIAKGWPREEESTSFFTPSGTPLCKG
jgi:hypothetical protein